VISHKYKFIFIHVPKTAGISVLDALNPFCDEEQLHYGHPLQSAYYKLLNADDYYQFTFIRNPFARLVSVYFYIRAGGMCVPDKELRDRLQLTKKTFKQFVLDFNVLESGVHFLPQLSFMNECAASVSVFRVENLQEDFNVVCDKIGIPQQQLPHHNKSKHKHYTEYYDDETREIVAQKYAKDIEYFGYKFVE
jgi:chondroitin 4-sulfotransferase 11